MPSKIARRSTDASYDIMKTTYLYWTIRKDHDGENFKN